MRQSRADERGGVVPSILRTLERLDLAGYLVVADYAGSLRRAATSVA